MPNKMMPCKHLDYSPKYPDCKLVQIGGFSCRFIHWKRLNVPYEGAPVDVQFCGAGRGRINDMFACYNPGEMHCYEPADSDEFLPVIDAES